MAPWYSLPVLALLTLLVVRDPGHGGSETGARGVRPGMIEKAAALEYARSVKVLLEQQGVRVLMTRQIDELVPIRERVRWSNQHKADAFVSIHLNASFDRTQQGFETYVLDRHNWSRDAKEVALREGAARGPAVAILSSLELEAAQAHAARLGLAIQRRLATVLGTKWDRGLKQAPLDILKGHRAPAVLVEVGFIDHAEEGPRITSESVRSQVASAIVSGILDYQATRK